MSEQTTEPLLHLTTACWPVFEFLTNFIRQVKHGSVPAADIYKKAEAELSVSKATVKRAKSGLGGSVVAERESRGNEGAGRWVWRLARVSPSSDPLATPKNDPLARTVVPQGFSASDESQGAQGSQDNRRETLADSGSENGLFHDLPPKEIATTESGKI